MGRKPCCNKEGLNKGAWNTKEDMLLTEYIKEHGEGTGWSSLPKKAGLLRCGKSCRLRWVNYLKPGLKRGTFTPQEDDLIVRLYTLLGSRWSLIAKRIPGRTDNDIKNYWNTSLLKKLKAQGNEPRRHKSQAKQRRRKTNVPPQMNQKNNEEKKTRRKKKGKIDEKCNIDDKDKIVTNMEEQSHTSNFAKAVSANNHNFTCSSRSQDGTSSATSTSEVHCSQNIEDQSQDEIYEKLQVIDELLLNDNCLFPPEKCIEYFNNSESHNMLLEEVYEEYFQLVSENSCHF